MMKSQRIVSIVLALTLVITVSFVHSPSALAADDGFDGYVDFIPVSGSYRVTVKAGSYTDFYFYGDPIAGDYYANILVNTNGCTVSSRYSAATGIWSIDTLVCYRVRTDTRSDKFYIRFTNNTSSELSFEIRRCFGAVQSSSVVLEPSDFKYLTGATDYAPENVNSSVYLPQFPTEIPLYTETTQNAAYYRYVYFYCDATRLAGLDSVTLRFFHTATSTNNQAMSWGDLINVEVFSGNDPIPCELSNIPIFDLTDSPDMYSYYDVKFTPPSSGKLVIRILLCTAYYREYENESTATVKTTLTVRDIIGHYKNTYSLYDFYKGLSSDIGVSFDDLIVAIGRYSSELVMAINNSASKVTLEIQGWSQEIINSIVYFKNTYLETQGTIIGKLETIIGNGTEGQAAKESADDIESGVSDIGGFEQGQMDSLDSGLSNVVSTVDFVSFSGPLEFVQYYINMAVDGISGYMIVFTLPLFLGLFFFLCSRMPGATRWKSRPPKS